MSAREILMNWKMKKEGRGGGFTINGTILAEKSWQSQLLQLLDRFALFRACGSCLRVASLHFSRYKILFPKHDITTSMDLSE